MWDHRGGTCLEGRLSSLLMSKSYVDLQAQSLGRRSGFGHGWVSRAIPSWSMMRFPKSSGDSGERSACWPGNSDFADIVDMCRMERTYRGISGNVY